MTMNLSPNLFALIFAGSMLAAPALAQQPKAKSSPAASADRKLVANALSAAPSAVARTATVVAMDKNGQMRTLRNGTGAFTCMPDNPQTRGNDPMCADANAMQWVHAWMTKQVPAADKIGLMYMLKGGSDASNDDPYATAPRAGGKWIDTGPHVMVVGGSRMLSPYPRTADDPRQPYVMWPGTPYEHIMIPVR